MPKFEGVCKAASGTWYLKVRVAEDPLTKEWRHVIRRGFASALEASPREVRARHRVSSST